MKQRLLEILDETKEIHNKLIDITKNKIINNESLLNLNNDKEIKNNNIRLEVLRKEMELLMQEYELEKMVDTFKQTINKIVEDIKEEDGEIS